MRIYSMSKVESRFNKCKIYLLLTPKHTYAYGFSAENINSNILGSNGSDIETV
jgi:hypothetical protein